jgi:signal transduction histidine kinase
VARTQVGDVVRLEALLDAVLLIETDLDLDVLLQRIVDVAIEQSSARYGALGVLDERGVGLSSFVYSGVGPELVATIGHLPEGLGVLGIIASRDDALLLDDIASDPASVGFPAGHPPMTTFLGAPIRVRDVTYGNLYLTDKEGGAPFDAVDAAVVEALADAAGIAISNARLRERVRVLGVAEDRDRIARDLHDTVIQRLYGIGLALQSSLSLVEGERLRARLQASLDEVDATIRQIRTTIFELEPPRETASSLRAQVIDLLSEAGRVLGFEPEVRFVGALDTLVGTHMIAEVLAVLRESLSNVARHAYASHVETQVALVAGELVVTVEDDGRGIALEGAGLGNGLRNLAQRAEMYGGSFSIERGVTRGTTVAWTVPL